MRYRSFRVAFVCVAFVLPLLLAPLSAGASTTHVHRSATFTETHKVTLNEYSYTSPSLWTYQNDGTAGATVGDAALLAWVGVDPGHSINFMRSADGFTYTNKVTLDQQSIARPAIVEATDPLHEVLIAWTGTDPQHRLNIYEEISDVKHMLTVDDNSASGPSIVIWNSALWMAWTGTDPNHSLNIRRFPFASASGLEVDTAVTLSQYSAKGSPTLALDSKSNQLLLTWTDTGQSHYLPNALPYINILRSPDGKNWSPAFSPPAPQISDAGPSITAVAASGEYYWAWSGTDSLHSLNLAATTTVNSWPAPITTLDEQAFGGPSIGPAPTAKQVLMAWAGIDPYHSINIASFSGN